MSCKPLINSHKDMQAQLSIREVCNILGIDLPNENNTDSYSLIDIDKPCTVTTTKWGMKTGGIAIARKNGIDVYSAVEKHASMIIDDFAYRNTDAYSVKFPKGMTAKAAYTKVCRYIKQKYNIPTIVITGNAGKTTTKDLISSVFIEQKNTLCVQKNYNTLYTAGEIIQNLSDEHEMYIQEVHEPHADFCSEMLCPDVVVLTNLERAHLDETGASLQSSINSTLKILNHLKPNGVIFANNSCQYLANQTFEGKKVIRYGISSDATHYWAENVVNHGAYTTFTICSKFDAPICVTLHIAGIHNVGNAVGAYAVGRYYDIPPQKIVEALERYRPNGIRQNLMEVDDRYVLIDCYSTTVLSSVAAGKTLCELPLKKGAKRVIVLSYLPTLGTGSESVHRDVGRGIAQLPIDMIVAYRNDAKYIVDECINAGKTAVFFQYHKDVINYLNGILGKDDVIAFKGVTYAHLEQVANAVLGLNIIPENNINDDRPHNGGDF